jgi:hypothetical protein
MGVGKVFIGTGVVTYVVGRWLVAATRRAKVRPRSVGRSKRSAVIWVRVSVSCLVCVLDQSLSDQFMGWVTLASE